jgi:hypothetical protein
MRNPQPHNTQQPPQITTTTDDLLGPLITTDQK